MIGDWVRNDFGENQQIVEIRQDCVMLAYNDTFSLGKIEPIPLTSEILEKNGFERTGDGWECCESKTLSLVIHELEEDETCFDIWIAEPMDWKHLTYSLPLPKYVHELQHSLRLCGIDKTIEL